MKSVKKTVKPPVIEEKNNTNYRLSREERETHFCIDDADKVWSVYTNIQRHMNKFQRQGWELVKTELYPDGEIMSMKFKAPEFALSICSAKKRTLVLTDEQRSELAERAKRARAIRSKK